MQILRYKTISALIVIIVIFTIAGCEQSANNDDEKVKPIPVADKVPTAANDGLKTVDLSGITASNFVTAGTGTNSREVESISVDVPVGAIVEHVFLYWSRREYQQGSAPPEIEVNGTVYSGSITGGPVDTENPVEKGAGITHRVDLTGEGLVQAGTTILNVKDDQPEPTVPLGASVVVFYSMEGENSELLLYHGVDFAWTPAMVSNTDKQEALRTSVPVTFTFEATDIEREATLTLLIGDIGHESTDRPNSLKVEVGDLETQLIGPEPNPFQGAQGAEWDNYIRSITIPAGAETVRVFPVSGPGEYPASLVWALAGLSVPEPQ